MRMRGRAAAVFMVILFMLTFFFAGGEVCAAERWTLVHEDEGGNLMYIDEESVEPLSDMEGALRVTMRFELASSETTMFFVDELDCEGERIRRLSLTMYDPVCTGREETYSSGFKPRWDKVSEGLERTLFSTLCD